MRVAGAKAFGGGVRRRVLRLRCDDRGRAGAGRRAWRAPASVVRRGSIGRTTYRTGTRQAGGTRMRWRIWHV